MQKADINAVLEMVKFSAEKIAPEEMEDFGDYQAAVLKSNGLPNSVAAPMDQTTAAMIDGHIITGIGLSLLGTIATELLAELRKKVVQTGAESIWAYLQKKCTPDAVKDDVSDEIVVRMKLPKGVEASQVHLAITCQIETLYKSSELTVQLDK